MFYHVYSRIEKEHNFKSTIINLEINNKNNNNTKKSN